MFLESASYGPHQPPDRDRRHRRPCDRSAAHVPAQRPTSATTSSASSATTTSASAVASRCSAPIDELEQVIDEHRRGRRHRSRSRRCPTRSSTRMTRRLTDGGYHVALSSSLRDIDITRLRPQQFDGRTMIYVEPIIRNGWRAVAKRAVRRRDRCIVALVPTCPCSSPSPRSPTVFKSAGRCSSVRSGSVRDGQLFEIIKLRTMVVDAEARKAELMDRNEIDGAAVQDPQRSADHPDRSSPAQALDRRAAPVLERASRGDERRRPAPGAARRGRACGRADAHERLRVLPGITGMWQVSGRSDTSFDDYKRLDLYYVDNWSLLHDLIIVAKTFGAVVSSRGAELTRIGCRASGLTRPRRCRSVTAGTPYGVDVVSPERSYPDRCCTVVELRQYTLHPSRRDDLIDLFDREFVETQEAAGMHIVGQFREPRRPGPVRVDPGVHRHGRPGTRRCRTSTEDRCGRSTARQRRRR